MNYLRKRKPYTPVCDLCEEPIYMWQPHYEMPDGDYICENCVDDWVAQYHVMGEVDLGFD